MTLSQFVHSLGSIHLCSCGPHFYQISKDRPVPGSRLQIDRDLVDGQYRRPVRIVCFNSVEAWCRDVTLDIADELRRRYVEFGEVPDPILDFMDANRR